MFKNITLGSKVLNIMHYFEDYRKLWTLTDVKHRQLQSKLIVPVKCKTCHQILKQNYHHRRQTVRMTKTCVVTEAKTKHQTMTNTVLYWSEGDKQQQLGCSTLQRQQSGTWVTELQDHQSQHTQSVTVNIQMTSQKYQSTTKHRIILTEVID